MNRAFSAQTEMHKFLGRCPRLAMSCAVGARSAESLIIAASWDDSALVEIYDLDQTVDSKPLGPELVAEGLANISTRGLVQASDNAMIAGIIVLGQAFQRVLARAIGPSLTVSGALSDPTSELRDSNGTLIRANDNWRSDQEAEITATGLAPSNDAESAIVATLPANGAAHTAIVRGANSGTGVALVEVYALTN